jgi:hypothetical protein
MTGDTISQICLGGGLAVAKNIRLSLTKLFLSKSLPASEVACFDVTELAIEFLLNPIKPFDGRSAKVKH